MALKFSAPFPLFSPNPNPPCGRPAPSSTELRFSRWNNANAEPFVRRQREQKEIEDEIRRHRRYQSVLKIAEDAADDAADTAGAAGFKSRGTPSSPSSPSIPGKASKYSKPPSADKPRHPAFRPSTRPWRSARIPPEPDEESGVLVGEKGVTYRFKDAPFEFQYSYTETPKVKPVALREPLFLPFGPSTMPRPWTGRAPLPPSKKKLPEFDSFNPPPPGKKGVKTVQSPGPFVAGSGPKYHAASREEILGEPLTDEEVKELVKGCLKAKRQLNMGRDGLTHNMLDNIHAHWKRRRVCKIKCKGVCTVDMDNVRQQLEEKTGGKIIYGKGGVIFLFRGRNYNYRTRPRFPLMLWKPVSPVYPRLVQQVPEGLTLEEATDMRKKGRQLPPICKLGKNGVYCNLVNQVKEAFEACELVRINCKGLNKSDCRKIGAKLKDLVPCVLLSFEYEHILMWRGKNWVSSFPSMKSDQNEGAKSFDADAETTSSSINDEVITDLGMRANSHKEFCSEKPKNDMALEETDTVEESEDVLHLKETNQPLILSSTVSSNNSELSSLSLIANQETSAVVYKETPNSGTGDQAEELIYKFPGQNKSSEEGFNLMNKVPYQRNSNKFDNYDIAFREDVSSESNSELNIYVEDKFSPKGSDTQELATSHLSLTKLEKDSEIMIIDNNNGNSGMEIVAQDGIPDQNTTSSSSCLEGVMLLLNEAVESGSAVILDNASLEPDIVFQKSVALSKIAPPGPRFQHKLRKVAVASAAEETSGNEIEEPDLEVGALSASDKRTTGGKKSRMRRNNLPEILPDVVPRGSLRVDELAKLLS